MRDSVGNTSTWGPFEVRENAVPTGDVPGLSVKLDSLPAWVAWGCSVRVLRTEGRVDSVVSRLPFKPNADSSVWTARWEAYGVLAPRQDAQATVDGSGGRVVADME